MPTKFCKLCSSEKDVSLFGLDRGRKDGLTYRCLACRKVSRNSNREFINAQKREHYSKNKDRLLSEKRAIYIKDSDKKRDNQKAYHAQRKDELKEKSRAYYKNNPDYYKEYRRKNYAKVNAKESRRRSAKILRTPPWLTKDDHWMIEQAYSLAELRTKIFGFQWHVDHIIPLQGKLVSGLHVPLNLQVIPGSVNTSKRNYFEV